MTFTLSMYSIIMLLRLNRLYVIIAVNKQTNNQTIKQAIKQANNQTSKQVNKQMYK